MSSFGEKENTQTDRQMFSGEDRTVMVETHKELGVYQLTRILGRGGMGEVWQAFDKKLERDVALKLMRRELLANDEAVKRFYREARAVARLNHPTIVQVYTFGEEKGVIYFVMELVEGETVTQRLKRNGALPLQEAVFILLQTIEGLGYASARGIIHRDIKPSNLMLTSDFHLKIADFGLAKMIEHDTQVTATGTSMGSPNYMSPEQARGQEADHRSDIYSLGITFYQMILNSLPFTADSPITVLLKQVQEPLPEPPELVHIENGRVLEIIRKMTQKDPEERYQTYGGLAAAIAVLAPEMETKRSSYAPTTSITTQPEPGSEPVTRADPAVNSAASTEFVNSGQAPTVTQAPPLAEAATVPNVAKRRLIGMGAAALAVAGIAGIGVMLWSSRPREIAAVPPKADHTSTTPAPSPIPRAEIRPDANVRSGASGVNAVATPTAQLAIPTQVALQPTPVFSTTAPVPTSAISGPEKVSIPPDAASIAPVITPAPTEATVTVSDLVIKGDPQKPGEPVPVLNAQGQMISTLNPLQKVKLVRSHTDAYEVSINGTPGFVNRQFATPDYAGAPELSSGATVTKTTTYILGNREDTMPSVQIYASESTKRMLTSVPAKTEIEVLGENAGMLHFMYQGKDAYVLSTMAYRKP